MILKKCPNTLLCSTKYKIEWPRSSVFMARWTWNLLFSSLSWSLGATTTESPPSSIVVASFSLYAAIFWYLLLGLLRDRICVESSASTSETSSKSMYRSTSYAGSTANLCLTPSVPGTHPRAMKFAVCDVITPDIAMGPLASTAEMLTITQEILAAFPTCSQNFDLCVSHSKSQCTIFTMVYCYLRLWIVSEIALDRVPLECRSYIVDLFTKQTKSSTSQKRALLLKKGLLRSVVDDLEILNETGTDLLCRIMNSLTLL